MEIQEIRKEINRIIDSKKEEIKLKNEALFENFKHISKSREEKIISLDDLYIQKGKLEDEIYQLQEELENISMELENTASEVEGKLFESIGISCKVRIKPLFFKD